MSNINPLSPCRASVTSKPSTTGSSKRGFWDTLFGTSSTKTNTSNPPNSSEQSDILKDITEVTKRDLRPTKTQEPFSPHGISIFHLPDADARNIMLACFLIMIQNPHPNVLFKYIQNLKPEDKALIMDDLSYLSTQKLSRDFDVNYIHTCSEITPQQKELILGLLKGINEEDYVGASAAAAGMIQNLEPAQPKVETSYFAARTDEPNYYSKEESRPRAYSGILDPDSGEDSGIFPSLDSGLHAEPVTYATNRESDTRLVKSNDAATILEGVQEFPIAALKDNKIHPAYSPKGYSLSDIPDDRAQTIMLKCFMVLKVTGSIHHLVSYIQWLDPENKSKFLKVFEKIVNTEFNTKRSDDIIYINESSSLSP